MSVTVFIPQKNKRSVYSAYIHGKVVSKYYEEDVGSLFAIEGTAVIFYSYSNYRRAYIFCEKEHNSRELPFFEGNIPLVKQKVNILYCAERRKVDLLKFLLYRTEKEYGQKIFEYEPEFWLKVSCLLDKYYPKKRQSAANRRNIERLIRMYERKKELSS